MRCGAGVGAKGLQASVQGSSTYYPWSLKTGELVSQGLWACWLFLNALHISTCCDSVENNLCRACMTDKSGRILLATCEAGEAERFRSHPLAELELAACSDHMLSPYTITFGNATLAPES